MPMGCDLPRWTPPGEKTLDELSPILSPLASVKQHVTAITNLELRNAYPGHPRHVQLRIPERRAGQADREHRLLPGDHRRPDRRAADRPGDATAVARDVDGPALDRRPVRQRIRLRLSEQPLVVVADDPLAVRGTPSDRLRAALRRRRDCRGTSGRPEEAGEPARLGHRRDLPPQDPAWPGRSQSGQPVSGNRPRGRAADPEGRGRREGQHPAGPRPAGGRPGPLRRSRPA